MLIKLLSIIVLILKVKMRETIITLYPLNKSLKIEKENLLQQACLMGVNMTITIKIP